jgi:hypothetical protein
MIHDVVGGKEGESDPCNALSYPRPSGSSGDKNKSGSLLLFEFKPAGVLEFGVWSQMDMDISKTHNEEKLPSFFVFFGPKAGRPGPLDPAAYRLSLMLSTRQPPPGTPPGIILCFMYNESLELTAPQHTAVKT